MQQTNSTGFMSVGLAFPILNTPSSHRRPILLVTMFSDHYEVLPSSGFSVGWGGGVVGMARRLQFH